MRNIKSLSVVALLLTASPAFARGFSSSSGGTESMNLLSIGAGIASPSVTSALSENPAGLVSNETPKILGVISTENNSWDPLGYGGFFFTGNGAVGAGIGVQNYSGVANGSTLQFGVAAEITQLAMTIGASGSYALSNGIGDRFGADLGLQFNARGPFKVGLAAFNVNGGPDSYGAGFSYDANPNARIVLDASVNNNFDGLRLKPALGITVQKFQITYGYGIKVDNTVGSFIRDGSALGLGYEFGHAFQLQGYYNQIAKYYVAGMFRF